MKPTKHYKYWRDVADHLWREGFRDIAVLKAQWRTMDVIADYARREADEVDFDGTNVLLTFSDLGKGRLITLEFSRLNTLVKIRATGPIENPLRRIPDAFRWLYQVEDIPTAAEDVPTADVELATV